MRQPGGAGQGARGAGASAKALTLEDLVQHYHLPINDVARKLGICVTVLKARCRDFGIQRWPYRKMKKLDNLISALEGEAGREGGGQSEARLKQLDAVRQTREYLLQHPNSTVHLNLGKIKAGKRPKSAATSARRLAAKPEGGAGLSGQSSGQPAPLQAQRAPQPAAGEQAALAAAGLSAFYSAAFNPALQRQPSTSGNSADTWASAAGHPAQEAGALPQGAVSGPVPVVPVAWGWPGAPAVYPAQVLPMLQFQQAMLQQLGWPMQAAADAAGLLAPQQALSAQAIDMPPKQAVLST